MKLIARVTLSLLVLVSQLGTAAAGEIIPDESVTFRATFESREEAQEYLSTFFRAKGYQLKAEKQGFHFLYAGLPNGQHAIAHGTILPGVEVCVRVDLYSEELRSEVKDRSPASRERMSSEASQLTQWLNKAGASSVRGFAARPYSERQSWCALTPRSSGRVDNKVPSSYIGVRAAQLNR